MQQYNVKNFVYVLEFYLDFQFEEETKNNICCIVMSFTFFSNFQAKVGTFFALFFENLGGYMHFYYTLFLCFHKEQVWVVFSQIVPPYQNYTK